MAMTTDDIEKACDDLTAYMGIMGLNGAFVLVTRYHGTRDWSVFTGDELEISNHHEFSGPQRKSKTLADAFLAARNHIDNVTIGHTKPATHNEYKIMNGDF